MPQRVKRWSLSCYCYICWFRRVRLFWLWLILVFEASTRKSVLVANCKMQRKELLLSCTSALFRILKGRFILFPIKVIELSNDIITSEAGEFIDLNLRLALNLNIIPKGFLKMTYDYFCPSIKLQLSARTSGCSDQCRVLQKSSNK